jgi:hypothetical protein
MPDRRFEDKSRVFADESELVVEAETERLRPDERQWGLAAERPKGGGPEAHHRTRTTQARIFPKPFLNRSPPRGPLVRKSLYRQGWVVAVDVDTYGRDAHHGHGER